jgi:hypothetical protein
VARVKAQESVAVRWTANVKYNGKRYRAGEQAEIKPEDRDELLAAGVIREEAPDGNVPD